MKGAILISILAVALAALACDGATETPAPISQSDISTIIAATFAADQQATQGAIHVSAATVTSIPVPTSTSAAESVPVQQSSIGKVGMRLVQGDYALTVTNTDSAQSYGTFYTAATGKRLLAVEVLIESSANSDVNVNPFYASIKDSDSYQYNMTSFGKDPALQSENDLPAGDKMRGWVTFEIPISAHGLIFVYSPLTLGNDIRFEVDLGQ